MNILIHLIGYLMIAAFVAGSIFLLLFGIAAIIKGDRLGMDD